MSTTQSTKIYNKFEYHLEDLDCKICLHYKGWKKICSYAVCPYKDIRDDAIAGGRIDRKCGKDQ